MNSASISGIDIAVIVVYLVGIIWYGISKGKRKSSEEYFLAGRNMTWPFIGISLLAANVGSHTLIGLSSDAFRTNVAVYNYEWMAAVVLVFFAIFFMPFYLKSGVYTMPEFLQRRYDIRSRYYFSFITLVGNVLIDTAACLYAGNLILKILFPEIDSTILIICLAVAAAAYTIPGGLSSVIHTEVIQAILILIGSGFLTYFAFAEVGGWDGLMAGLSDLNSSGYIQKAPEEVFSLVRPIDDPDLPWAGLVLGVPLLGFYFWANNQFMVQRILSAKNLDHGRWGALFGGFLKLPLLFIMVFPGVAALVLFSDMDISSINYYIPNANGEMVLCENLKDCPNMTYPVMLYNLLPVGLLGLVIACLLAAMSSTISATLNSASTLITMDFINQLKPGLKDKQLVRIGQVSTVVLVTIASLWAPQIEKFSSLWEYLQKILAYISPPVISAFLLGLFWKRGNGNGAFYSLAIGFFIALFLVFADIFEWFTFITNLHFLYIPPILLSICMLIHIVFSLASTPPTEDKLKGMIWTKRLFREESEELKGRKWYMNYRILAILLLLITMIIVVMYW